MTDGRGTGGCKGQRVQRDTLSMFVNVSAEQLLQDRGGNEGGLPAGPSQNTGAGDWGGGALEAPRFTVWK